jgi:hypothetical protein
MFHERMSYIKHSDNPHLMFHEHLHHGTRAQFDRMHALLDRTSDAHQTNYQHYDRDPYRRIRSSKVH